MGQEVGLPAPVTLTRRPVRDDAFVIDDAIVIEQGGQEIVIPFADLADFLARAKAL